ncbi:MAG: ThiF family adenylyltransferase [bacterium]|nr:ThiF family adenylyltransferase [bacterium]
MVEKIVITDLDEDRYSRLTLIPWWNQEKLKNTRVMVVGAGALGNEVLKNLALLGVGKIIIVDFDRIVQADLSRSILYRAADNGKKKVEVASQRVLEINPDIRIQPLAANIVWDVGLGLFRSVDVVIGCVDNREARLAINQACWKTNTPWIDGGIDVLHGIVSVFVPPQSACYECTLTDLDYNILGVRYSCPLLRHDDLLEGKTPTTSTSASIIAGIQVQEAVKIIHGLEVPKGKGIVFNGLMYECYLIEYPKKNNCQSHEYYEKIVELNKGVEETTFRELLDVAQKSLGDGTILELDRDIVTKFRCNKCNEELPVFKVLGKITIEEGKCPKCGEIRMVDMTNTISAKDEFIDKTLGEAGIPPLHIITARKGKEIINYQLSINSY